MGGDPCGMTGRFTEWDDRQSGWGGAIYRGRRLPGADDLVLMSNDYLSLANHPELVEAQVRALRQQGNGSGWKVPLLITVGSPLAITEVRSTLRFLNPIRCPECVSAWFNAMDKRDVVALYPLDSTTFPLDPPMPAIENKTDVRNRTGNRHGIAGYLDDAEVARRIHQALTA